MHPTGSTSGSGSGSTPTPPGTLRARSRDERGLKLHEVDLAADFGYDIPGAAAATHRAPCGACGLSKRHLFNAVAVEHGYDVVATGHNLDDEAAVLLGNVLRWETGYLGRQHPVLPASAGFARKVKPLYRLGERETAAYCLLRDIDYQVEECPMAEGNRHLGYKEVLNALEDRSPGAKAAFVFGFVDRGARPLHRRRRRPSAKVSRRVSVCGSPTTSDVCAFCRLQERAGYPRRPIPVVAVGRPFAAGDRVLLVDAKRRRHLVTLSQGGTFHTHAGVSSTTL